MFKKLLNLIFLSLKGYSLLRSYQLNECKNIKLRGYSIEFGAYKEKKKNFYNHFKGNAKFVFSNIYHKRDKHYIKLDLTKKLKIKKNTFQNVILMNVLEHLPNLNNVFKAIKGNSFKAQWDQLSSRLDQLILTQKHETDNPDLVEEEDEIDPYQEEIDSISIYKFGFQTSCVLGV